MKLDVNIIAMSEIDKYLDDQYDKTNKSFIDARDLLEEFKRKNMLGYNIAQGDITIGDTIESYELYDFLNTKYNKDNYDTIVLLKTAIKYTQSKQQMYR